MQEQPQWPKGGAIHAVVAIGGLMVSTFLTLIYVPIFYTLFEDALLFAKGMVGRVRGSSKGAPVDTQLDAP